MLAGLFNHQQVLDIRPFLRGYPMRLSRGLSTFGRLGVCNEVTFSAAFPWAVLARHQSSNSSAENP